MEIGYQRLCFMEEGDRLPNMSNFHPICRTIITIWEDSAKARIMNLVLPLGQSFFVKL